MENNRNFFITIALSVLILTVWQVFYMNPQHRKRARGRPRRAGAGGRAGQPPQPPHAGRAGRRRAGGAARRRSRRMPARVPTRRDARCRDRRQPARHDRHAEPVGLDQPDRRASRRSAPQGLPRRPSTTRRRPSSCSARRRCRTAISPRSAMSASRRPARVPGADTVWTVEGKPDADADDAGHADLHQRQGPDLQAHHLGRHQLHVHRSPTRSANAGTAPGVAVELRPRHALRQADARQRSTCCTRA